MLKYAKQCCAFGLMFFGTSLSGDRQVMAAILVSDRLSNSVYQYSDGGGLLGVVVSDAVNLDQPTGMAISPDQTKLYVASSNNNRVVRYDYNAVNGTASNPAIFATAANGISFPSDIRFSPDGSRIYISNLGGTGVTQLNTDGTSAGPAINGLIGGGSIFQFSSLAFAPTGELLVGGFQDFPAGTSGSVARSNAGLTALNDFIAPSMTLNGASGLLVNGNDLYVSGLFASNIQRFNATTGALDGTFNGGTGSISGLAFPQDLILAPDGNGFLAGILGFVNGSGSISRFDFNGSSLGVFASAGGGGFTEATSMLYVAPVPEPSSFGLVAASVLLLNRRKRRRHAIG
jgi:DNA-binding beta-propeller fold protein YncE